MLCNWNVYIVLILEVMNSNGNGGMNTSPQLYCWESHSKLGFDFFCFEFISVSLKSYKHLCYVFNFFAVSLLKRHCEYSSHHLWQCLQNWDFSLGVIGNILTKCFLKGGCYWKNIYKVKFNLFENVDSVKMKHFCLDKFYFCLCIPVLFS